MDKLPVTSAESIKLNLGKIRSNKILRGNKTVKVLLPRKIFFSLMNIRS